MNVEEMIRQELEVAVSTVPKGSPAGIESIQRRGGRRAVVARTGLVLAGAAVFAGAFGVSFLFAPTADPSLATQQGESIYIAEGEKLIASDPPIVQGAESPEPAFDIGGLGDEAQLAPVADTSKIMAVVDAEGAEGEIIRITVLGETPEGVLALIVHLEGKDLRGNPIQLRCQTTTLGTQTCGGGAGPDEVVSMPGGLEPAQPGGGPNYTVGEVASDSTLIWEVSDETSVVTLTLNGQMRWQRPVAGVAAFITGLVYGDRFELTAYDAQGNIVDSVTKVVKIDDLDG